MNRQTRRIFLKDLGLGAAALSAAEVDQARQMPGRPPSADTSPKTSGSGTVMAIAAHPGDAFFAMGAPVALQVHQKGKGVLLSLSLGEKGSPAIAPARYGALQHEASERAAAVMGARALFLAYPDGEIPASEEAKFAVCDLIREYRPSVIVTHWRGSWHKDHRACYKIVNDAIFYAALTAIVRQRPAHTVSSLFFADNWEDAKDFQADTYLDITSVFDRWFEACGAFPMWRGENGFRYNDYYRSLAVQRGCLAEAKYAVALMSPTEQLVRHVGTL